MGTSAILAAAIPDMLALGVVSQTIEVTQGKRKKGRKTRAVNFDLSRR